MELRERVITSSRLGPVRRIAGVDVGFENGNRVARAAVAILDYPSLQLVDSAVARATVRFPYVPGYLSFREVPPLLRAFDKLRLVPDLVLCDGQGYAHPRRFGLACHFGVLTGLPTIGAAKSRLIGTHRRVGRTKGSRQPLRDAGEIIGAVVRTRDGVNPMFVSIGHRVDLETAVHWVLECCPRYRLPETTRAAHRLASGPA